MGQAGHRGEGQRVFETVLVADRGLLAVRVIRSCQRLGIKAVTLVAEGDENALHARLADEAIGLGTSAGPLSADSVIEAARVSGAQAVHPGGGAGAVDATLAEAVRAADLALIGAAPGEQAAAPGWPETVRRGDRSVLWETDQAPDADHRTLVGADRLIEALTGVDLVERQLRAAAGERVGEMPRASGYAIQAALYAGPQTLVPVAVSGWVAPAGEGIVTDSVLADGAWLTRHDDALLALITALGHDRAQALDRLRSAVDGMAASEPPAEVAALQALLREPPVVG